MIYLVIWTVSVWVSTSCPDFKPDPYTGEYPSMHCLVNHGKVVERDMVKQFSTLKEAQDFISSAPPEIKNAMKIKKKRVL